MNKTWDKPIQSTSWEVTVPTRIWVPDENSYKGSLAQCTVVLLQTQIGPENLRWHGLDQWLWSYSIHNDISGWQELPQCANDQAIAHLQTKTVPQNLRLHGLAQTHGFICNSIQSTGGLATKSMEGSYVYWQTAYCTLVILVVLSL